jgi:hypothetical protein
MFDQSLPFSDFTDFFLASILLVAYRCERCSLFSTQKGLARGIAPVTGPTRVEVSVSHAESLFRPTPGGYYMACLGPAWNEEGRYCHKKLCFVATDRTLLADVLRRLAERPDCYYVKYSVHPRDGMYLGRCFLMDEHEVGMLWAEYKQHPHLFCSVQDDDFTAPYLFSGSNR